MQTPFVVLVNLDDEITVGRLRAAAAAVGKRLVVSFTDGALVESAMAAARGGMKAGARVTAGARIAAIGAVQRRPLSPATRARLAKNLVKARAARARKLRRR